MIERVTEALEGRYRIVRELGFGGMATVFLAEDVKHGRLVALKVMRPEFGTTVGAERFLQEIRLAARLNHPKIVPLFDSGEAAGFLFYVMPYVEGQTLRTRLDNESQLPVPDAVHITMDICEALEHAHAQGMVHRDIKPENVAFSAQHAVLMDFGIALESEATGSLTSVGMVMGTPAYMSPEQASRGRVDARADLYATGCVLYEMLTGSPPFSGKTQQIVMMRHTIDAPPPISSVRPTVPPQLEAIVMQALEKVPADRFQNAAEMRAALESVVPIVTGPRLSTAAHAAPVKTSVQESGRRRMGWKIPAVVAVLVLLAATAALGYRLGWLRDTVPSIGVLAFNDLTPGKPNEYLGDGIAEELIMGLTRIPGLRVAARTSTFSFKDKNVDIPTIGRQLNVSNIVEGSVRRDGDSLRVIVRLMDGRKGFPIWSDEFMTSMGDVFQLQDRIARLLVERLKVALAEGGAPIIVASTTDTEAYELYLKARFEWNKRGQGILNALKLFEQAVAKDPNFAVAHAGLADAYSLLGHYGFIPAGIAFPKARAEAQRAVELNPNLGEAYAALGWVQTLWDWDWPAAERSFQRAVELNPSYPPAHYWHAMYLAVVGRNSASVEEARTAAKLDPLGSTSRVLYAQLLMMDGREADAVRELELTQKNDPTGELAVGWLSVAYSVVGRYEDAIKAAEETLQKSGRAPVQLSNLGVIYARAGRMADADAILSELQARARREHVQHLTLAHLLASMKKLDAAFTELDSAYAKKETLFLSMRISPEMRQLRDDPRYRKLLTRAGLPASARQ